MDLHSDMEIAHNKAFLNVVTKTRDGENLQTLGSRIVERALDPVLKCVDDYFLDDSLNCLGRPLEVGFVSKDLSKKRAKAIVHKTRTKKATLFSSTRDPSMGRKIRKEIGSLPPGGTTSLVRRSGIVALTWYVFASTVPPPASRSTNVSPGYAAVLVSISVIMGS